MPGAGGRQNFLEHSLLECEVSDFAPAQAAGPRRNSGGPNRLSEWIALVVHPDRGDLIRVIALGRMADAVAAKISGGAGGNIPCGGFGGSDHLAFLVEHG